MENLFSNRTTAITRLLESQRTDPNVNHHLSRTRNLVKFPLMNVASSFGNPREKIIKFFDAVQNGNVALVDEFIKAGVDPSVNKNFAIRSSSKYGYLGVVNRLLDDPRVNPAADYNYAIRKASKYGYIDVVERLLADVRVNPAADYNYAIRKASEFGHIDVVNRLLADERVDPSVDHNYAIRMASARGHLDVVNRLIADPRVDPRDYNNYALGAALQNGHVDVVNRLRSDPRIGNVVVGGSRKTRKTIRQVGKRQTKSKSKSKS